MAERYTGSYLERFNGWRAVAILADIGQASLVERIPTSHLGFDDEIDNQHLRITVPLSKNPTWLPNACISQVCHKPTPLLDIRQPLNLCDAV